MSEQSLLRKKAKAQRKSTILRQHRLRRLEAHSRRINDPQLYRENCGIHSDSRQLLKDDSSIRSGSRRAPWPLHRYGDQQSVTFVQQAARFVSLSECWYESRSMTCCVRQLPGHLVGYRLRSI